VPVTVTQSAPETMIPQRMQVVIWCHSYSYAPTHTILLFGNGDDDDDANRFRGCNGSSSDNDNAHAACSVTASALSLSLDAVEFMELVVNAVSKIVVASTTAGRIYTNVYSSIL
jgi:hypothetical protein